MSFVQVKNLTRTFDLSKPFLQRVISGEKKAILTAVNDVSFEINKNETFALVGESGSGKSTIAKLIAGLMPATSGSVTIDGQDIATADQALRQRMSMIFQDPYASLNPRWRVVDSITEPLKAFKIMTNSQDLEEEAARLLKLVGLDGSDRNKYPHEFSGGQRQRIAIARALSAKPELILCDEPTSALDVSVQAQILNLMKDLQDQFNLTYLIISHNLAVVKHMADRIGVLYLGKLVEVSEAKSLFQKPRHPYSQMLLEAVPDLTDIGLDRKAPAGEIPSPINPPSGCTFHPRCPLMQARCREVSPQLINGVSCHFAV